MANLRYSSPIKHVLNEKHKKSKDFNLFSSKNPNLDLKIEKDIDFFKKVIKNIF